MVSTALWIAAIAEVNMTPKGRANFRYYRSLGLCALGFLILSIGWQRSYVLVAIGATCIAAYGVVGIVFLFTSRCPHCQRFVDLRGGSAYCPRCGRWIPTREDEPIRKPAD